MCQNTDYGIESRAGDFFFNLNFWRTQVLFVGTLIPLFWTSGDVSSGFQSQSGQSYLHLAEAYVLHIPWDSPLVWHLPTSWWPACQLRWSLPHTYGHAWVGLKWETYRVTGERSTDWAMLSRLSSGYLRSITKSTVNCCHHTGGCFNRIFGGSLESTLVVAFGILPQNFGRWWGSTNRPFVILWTQVQW